MNPEDWRKKTFLAKFQAAAAELNAASHRDIESLKFRDIVGFHDYRELVKELGSLKVLEIQGDYQGKAWKLTDADGNSIIIVEHETGLEILYIHEPLGHWDVGDVGAPRLSCKKSFSTVSWPICWYSWAMSASLTFSCPCPFWNSS